MRGGKSKEKSGIIWKIVLNMLFVILILLVFSYFISVALNVKFSFSVHFLIMFYSACFVSILGGFFILRSSLRLEKLEKKILSCCEVLKRNSFVWYSFLTAVLLAINLTVILNKEVSGWRYAVSIIVFIIIFILSTLLTYGYISPIAKKVTEKSEFISKTIKKIEKEVDEK